MASRSRQEKMLGPERLDLCVDLSDLDSTSNVFHKIRDFFGEPPTVVVYNGGRFPSRGSTRNRPADKLPQAAQEVCTMLAILFHRLKRLPSSPK